ncbi:MAG: Ig-like domain-containing protein [Lentimicrobium sp.]|jgi:hypothetical protein|nr:Ig-like domain-containing protein [Lentimicrobium sp.]
MKTILITLAILMSAVFSLKGQNVAPVAINDTVEVVSQYPIVIDVLANDFDPDSDNISISYLSNPGHGTKANIDEKVLYKSYPYQGKDSLNYKIRDVGVPPLNSERAWIHINVIENPDIPIAVSDTFHLVELIPVSVNLLNNDYDPNGDEMKIASISSVTGCTVLLSEDSLTVIITPMLGHQSAKFNYNIIERATNNHFLSYTAFNYIYISENPDIPVAVNDSANTIGGIAVDIPVLANDFDTQGDLIEIDSFNQPQNGVVVKNNNILSYLPDLSFRGVDSLTYRIREVVDTVVISYYATVFVTVTKNPNCPIGVEDHASGISFVPINIDVLQNDYDINGDPFEIMDIRTHGGSAYIEGVSIRYTSFVAAVGMDSLEYRIRQTNDTLSFSEWTKVYIQLAINPDLPVTVNDSVITRAGIPVDIYPIKNDILNSSDTLIIFVSDLVGPYPHKGIITYKNDSMLTYVPYYKSKGEEVIQYVARDKNNQQIIIFGLIYVTILDQHFYDSLAVNNINAGINANGLLFSKIDEIPGNGYSGDMDAHYRFPKNGLKSTIFTSSLWFGGNDANGELHLAGERYKQNGIDFQAGPVSNIYDSSFYIKYGRTWKISKQEIEYHKNNFFNQGYQPAEAILNWPGNGNINLGQSQQLAPYKDINNDGIYNPFNGDYPLIRGDQTVFFMYNDDLEHTETGGTPIGIEVHGMVYGFDTPNDTALYNTVFVHYDLINRSSETLYNMHVGVFADLDIGYAKDDYVGCDVTRRSFFAYNGPDIDGSGEPEAFGENPPAQSVTILAGPYMDIDGIDNPAGGCDESVTGFNFGNEIVDDERLGLTSFVYFNNNSGASYAVDPTIAAEYQNYLNGMWRDQSTMLYGGNGHSASGAVGPVCKYLFPGDSDPLNWGTSCNFPEGGYNQQGKFWTEEETGNTPADRRGLGVMGPFTFESGEVQEIELAFCTGMGNAGAASSVNQLMNSIDSLLIAIDNGEVILPNNELGIESAILQESSILIFPNPASNLISISAGVIEETAEYSIFSIFGVKTSSGKLYKGVHSNIDVSALPSGLYLIRFTSGRGLFTGKFIKY